MNAWFTALPGSGFLLSFSLDNLDRSASCLFLVLLSEFQVDRHNRTFTTTSEVETIVTSSVGRTNTVLSSFSSYVQNLANQFNRVSLLCLLDVFSLICA